MLNFIGNTKMISQQHLESLEKNITKKLTLANGVTVDNIFNKFVMVNLIDKSKVSSLLEIYPKTEELMRRYETYRNNKDQRVYICETKDEFNILRTISYQHGDLILTTTPERILSDYSLSSIYGSMTEDSSVLNVFVKQE